MLSVSMIVKNEESCLRDCLESVKEADEIVIVDTGSNDRTIEIAKEYTDKVYYGDEYLWRDDFSFSRNQSLDKCSGDWVLTIDADETLEADGIKKIKEIIKDTKEQALFIKVKGKNGGSVHKSIRLFKKGNIKWKGQIHNYLSVNDGGKIDVTIEYGYSDAHKKDPDRALRILSKVVKENPASIREKYYLAREHWYRKDFKQALYYYDYYLETANWSPEMADAYLMKGYCYWNLGEIEKAKDNTLQAIKINADFKEAFILMSKLSGPKNKERWLKLSEMCNNEDVLFIR